MRTMIVAASSLLLTAALAGCGELPPSARLCLLTEADLGGKDALAVACPETPPEITLSKGQTYYIRHELQVGIEPPEKLHLRIDTVCGTREQLDVDHGMPPGAEPVAPVVVLPRTAPDEAPCSLTVNATIANSTLSIATRPVAGAACACALPDAGTGDGG